MTNNTTCEYKDEYVLTAEGDFEYKFHAELKFDRIPDKGKGSDICVCKMETLCGVSKSIAYSFSIKTDTMENLRSYIEEMKSLLFMNIRRHISKVGASDEFRSQNIV